MDEYDLEFKIRNIMSEMKGTIPEAAISTAGSMEGP